MRVITLCATILLVLGAYAQQVLYSEDFEGPTSSFTLNTSDAGSAISVWNTWLINNSYTGGSGDVVCLGFPFPYTIVSTPGQPGGITNANGKYLHTASVEGIADGIICCSFGAADSFCITADNTFSRMSADVSTVGSSDVSLSFWWLCQGGAGIYGQVYYSVNGGASWVLTSTPITNYNNQGAWVQQTVSDPVFGNQATLRFGFKFVNGVSASALDPGFAIDDVRIVANEAVPNTITAGLINPLAYCQGAALSVPFTAAGVFTAGNIFTAELSDAAGSFAAPTAIGTLSSTVSGSISCTVPALTPPGTAYRVRVVSDSPVTVGTANTVDISVSAAPFAGNDAVVSVCKNSGTYALLAFLPNASTCGSWTGPTGAPFGGDLNTSTDNGGLYTYTTNCPGGCPQDQATVTINLINPANAGSDAAVSLCSTGAPVSLISYVLGGDLTGIFFEEGQPTNGSSLGTPGVHFLEYVVYGTSPCINDTAQFVFTVHAAPDAGQNATHTVCANASAFLLFNVLGGSPDAGGTWTGPAGPMSGTFIPGTSQPGLYTYTVNGIGPCANASAFVAVVVDPCLGVEDADASRASLHWLGQDGNAHMFRNELGIITALEFVDASGRTAAVLNGPFAQGTVRVEPASMAAGVCVVRWYTKDAQGTLRMIHQTR